MDPFFIPPVPFYFVRHGETDWNHRNLIMGNKDIPLNRVGIMQANELAKRLKYLKIKTIISSPLQRALRTAMIINNALDKKIFVIDELKECAWGVLEGQDKRDGSWSLRWQKGEYIEAAEFYINFERRVLMGMNKALEFPEPILIVAHGGVYTVIRKLLMLGKVELLNCDPIFHRPPKQPRGSWFAYPIDDMY